MEERYRDRWIVVVDKPAGVPTQRTREGTDGIYEQLCGVESYVGLHHRLDRAASGLVLLTLDPRANRGVSQALQSRSMRRTYLAVLYGEVGALEWCTPIARKSAKTEVEVLGTGRGLTAVRLRLQSGRKHQIRIHASLAGTPVVGDRRYGGEAGRRCPRLALHATELCLLHPITGDELVVSSPVPESLAGLWKEAAGLEDDRRKG